MPVIILPRSTDQNGAAVAQTRLQSEIDDPYSAVMIVLGEGPEINRVVEVGVARASISALRRRIVWAQDVAVLTSEQREDYSPEGEVAAFIGLDNRVKKRLKIGKAQVPFYVEEAFTASGG